MRGNAGTEQLRKASDAMKKIVTAVTCVTDIMEEIASVSDEQSRGVNQAGLVVSKIDKVTQQNTLLIGKSAVAVLKEQASRLSQVVAALNITRHQQAARSIASGTPLT